MLENPLYIGDRIIDYADLQQDIRANLPGLVEPDTLNNRTMLYLTQNYLHFVADSNFKEYFQNEYGVDMSGLLQYKVFDRPIAVNPYNQEWGYVRLMQFSEYDNQPDYIELVIENPVSSCDERIWQRGEFILIWEGLVHTETEPTGGK